MKKVSRKEKVRHNIYLTACEFQLNNQIVFLFTESKAQEAKEEVLQSATSLLVATTIEDSFKELIVEEHGNGQTRFRITEDILDVIHSDCYVLHFFLPLRS